MSYRGLLRAGGHAQWAQEVVDKDGQLLYVLGLRLQHAEHQPVPPTHALRMGRPDVVLDDELPPPSAEPSPKKALYLVKKSERLVLGSVTLVLRSREHARGSGQGLVNLAAGSRGGRAGT